MSNGDPYVFRVFLTQPPAFVETWRQGPEAAEWHRHYLLSPGHGLSVVRGERVDLVRYRTMDGFRVEETLLSSAFPLDWMGLTCIATALPPALAELKIDGSSAQAFVDSMAVPELAQASVLKEVRTAFQGTVIARTSWLTVPEWDASGLAFSLSGMRPHALRALVRAGGFDGLQHRDLDDWLGEARRTFERRGGTRPQPGGRIRAA